MMVTLRSVVPVMALLVPVGVVGCGGSGNELTGSLASAYDVSYDTVTIQLLPYETVVKVSYTQGAPPDARSYAAVVVVDVSSFVRGQPLPLSDVHHVAPDGVGFPPMDEGTATFETELVPGETVKGSFQATFTTDQGVRRALMGSFEGTLVEAGTQ